MGVPCLVGSLHLKAVPKPEVSQIVPIYLSTHSQSLSLLQKSKVWLCQHAWSHNRCWLPSCLSHGMRLFRQPYPKLVMITHPDTWNAISSKNRSLCKTSTAKSLLFLLSLSHCLHNFHPACIQFKMLAKHSVNGWEWYLQFPWCMAK